MAPLTVIGSYLSPYVRKVLVCLELKGLAYCVDPIVPFYGNDEFSRLSPLRRIPVLVDGDVTLSDSTIICEYLEEKYPQPSIYPTGAEARARARWLEEFADSRMGEVFIWHYFNQLVIRRAVWGEPPDQAVLDKAIHEEIPAVLDYLEGEVPEAGFLFDERQLCVADVAIAAVIRNGEFARFEIDAARWPRTASHVGRVLEVPAFTGLNRFEQLLLHTKIADHRSALKEAGAPLSDACWATTDPRRGVMSI